MADRAETVVLAGLAVLPGEQAAKLVWMLRVVMAEQAVTAGTVRPAQMAQMQ